MAAIRHDVRTRMYLGGNWVDITDKTYVRDEITIDRGREDAADTTPPQTCELTLDNRSGEFSVRNPMGAYYGSIGRNNPLEVTVRRATDTFTRTVSNGWGTADTGQTYTIVNTSGSVADWNVAGGVGTMRVNVAGNYALSILNGLTARNVDVAGDLSVPITNVTGGTLEPGNLMLRVVDINTYYMLRVTISTAEAITIAIHHSATGDLTGDVATGLVHTSAQTLRMRFQAEDHTLRGKVWPSAGSEPLDWQVEVHDEQLDVAGFVGVRNGAGGGNTNVPIIYSHDNLVVSSPRFAGEVADLPSGSDVSNTDRYVQVEAAGPLRRLGQGTTPVLSAPRRHIVTNEPDCVYYWPLEEGPLAERGRPAIGNADMLSFALAPYGPVTQFGEGKIAPWLGNSPSLENEIMGVAYGTLSMSGFVNTDGWMVEYFCNTKGVDDSSDGFYVTTADARLWIVTPNHATGQIAVTTDFGNQTVSYPPYFDGTGHWMHFEARTIGANTYWQLWVDGVIAANSNGAGTGLTYPSQVVFVGGDKALSVGHGAVYRGSASSSERTLAMKGYLGEPSLYRMIRLCEENGIHLDYLGNPLDTPPMGPQGVKTLLELITECAEADGGTLYETKGTVGLAYRTRTDTYAQNAALTASVSGGQLASPFRPVEDDRSTRNKVTVKQTYGGDYTAELLTGRMSTQDFPNGVGVYDEEVTLNLDNPVSPSLTPFSGVSADPQGMAEWLMALGTTDEPRFPDIRFDLDNPAAVALMSTLYDLSVDDVLTLTGLDQVGLYDDVSLVQRGYREVWTNHLWRYSVNGSPASPYAVTVIGSSGTVLDSGSSVLISTINSSATTVGVSSSTGDLWTTVGADFPIAVMVGGEEWSVTNITGSASPQTFTMTRSVNGVVKGHSILAPVRVANPARVGL